MPRVSVIIPAFNCAEVLPDALRSVEAQTYDDWEVVVCDDASTDNTAVVAESFGERFRVVRSEENLGLAGARNKALSVAIGELVAFLDADDHWRPRYLEEQVALYDSAEAEHPGVGVVTCDALIVGPDGQPAGTFRERFPWPARPTLSKLLVLNPIHSIALMPRSIVEEVGGFSAELRSCEDHDLWLKVLERGYRPVSNPQVLATYTQREDSLSSDAAGMARNQQGVYRLALARGRLNRRERRIARRELRLHRLVEEIREIQGEKASSGRLPKQRVLRALPRAVAVGFENPQPWARLIRGKGGLRERFRPGREARLREQGRGGSTPSNDHGRPEHEPTETRVPRVSVIIPAHNSAELLPEALRSVEAQTYENWEAIVSDDGSSDNTADVAESFGGRFRVIHSKENAGPASARNKALAAAGGEFIALLDADDYWLPEFLAEQLALYESSESDQPGVGIVTCDARILGPGGYAPGTFRDRVPFPERPTLAKLLAENTIYVSGLMPRAIAEEVGGFAPECFGTEDYDLWIKVLERGYRPVSNPRALAVYRIQEASASADPVTVARNSQTVYRRALERGRLGRRERWIARRELRRFRLMEDIFEIQRDREESGRLPLARALRAAPRALAVTVESPLRSLRVVYRLFRMKGPLAERLSPGRETVLLSQG